MIALTAIRYLFLDACVKALFEGLSKNLKTGPDSKYHVGQVLYEHCRGGFRRIEILETNYSGRFAYSENFDGEKVHRSYWVRIRVEMGGEVVSQQECAVPESELDWIVQAEQDAKRMWDTVRRYASVNGITSGKTPD